MKGKGRRVIYAILAVAVILVVGRIVLLITSTSVAGGVQQNGRLADCPDTPNCVCSFDTEPEHAIDALSIKGSGDDTMSQLKACLGEMSGVTVVTSDATYLHAVCVTPVLRFKDDLELLLDEDSGLIHVRSASRVGHSDLGANRRRVEELRGRWEAFEAH